MTHQSLEGELPEAPGENTPPRTATLPAHRRHGTGIRGANLPRQSAQFEGRFGRMFRTLPAAVHSEEDLFSLAETMTANAEEVQGREDEIDPEENFGIPAGYTYFGQFIDHDLTFDPASTLQKINDPDGLTDFRTPRFDLDNIYGRGPDDQPYLYADDGVHMLLGRPLTGSENDPNTRDLPRNIPYNGEPKRALIGDPRNDENVIVSQLQGMMLRFHNTIVDRLLERFGDLPTIDVVQRDVRFHYQWVILHDFLPTIIGRETLLKILPQLADEGLSNCVTAFKPEIKNFTWKKDPFIPVEFSAAAYRFGHSLVRPIYRLNTTLSERQNIFASMDPNANQTSLIGFREFPSNWAVDWNLFFHISRNPTQEDIDQETLAHKKEALAKQRLQFSYKPDTSLVSPLGRLPKSIAAGIPSLAARNLLRGKMMSLPSGQAVARALGCPVIPDDKLFVGKATEEDKKARVPLVKISEKFANNAPLWYYILAEAQMQFEDNATPIRLGPVGGTIVGEVFVGLLCGDSHSYLQQDPGWTPINDFLNKKGEFGIAELIKAARRDNPPLSELASPSNVSVSGLEDTGALGIKQGLGPDPK